MSTIARRSRRARATGVAGTRSRPVGADLARRDGARPQRGSGRVPRGPATPVARARRLRAWRLLPPGRHDEHPVDLVARRLVLDAVADAPHAAEPPLVDVGGVVEHELLRLHVDLGSLLLVEGR